MTVGRHKGPHLHDVTFGPGGPILDDFPLKGVSSFNIAADVNDVTRLTIEIMVNLEEHPPKPPPPPPPPLNIGDSISRLTNDTDKPPKVQTRRRGKDQET